MAVFPTAAINTRPAGASESYSLRFNDDDTAYLSWTPSSAGNRKTWTWSGWVKRGNMPQESFFCAGASAGTNNNYLFIGWQSGDALTVTSYGSPENINVTTSALQRDTSSWYHIVVAFDTTQSTSSNRVKIYINGEQITSFSSTTYPTQNQQFYVNSTTQHQVGRSYESDYYFDGYLSEVNFIDGQALDPSYFGETGTYGEWKPIEYTGTYGTNGFYLPFKQDYQVEGFSAVTYPGDFSAKYIGGVGFQPDFVWIKGRTGTQYNMLFDAVRGNNKELYSNTNDAEATTSSTLTSFESDGFTIGADNDVNRNGTPFVAWSWDMGGSNATNTNGSITSTVRANPTYGQSIVSYTGNNTAGATVGHGLSQAPDMIIVKNRTYNSESSSGSWQVYHSGVDATAPEDYRLRLDDTGARTDTSTRWNDTAPTSTVFTLGSDWDVNYTGYSFIAYCFHSVSGYSKFGSYTGNDSTQTITTGFRPAFVMIKASSTESDWYILDGVRNDYSWDVRLEANSTNAEITSDGLRITDTGFSFVDSSFNNSGTTFIYMAFADTREFAYWLDQSGNNNDWTSNNLTESDILVDSPTNNFASMNSITVNGTGVLSEGNLQVYSSGDNGGGGISTMSMTSGKWYVEGYVKSVGANTVIGLAEASEAGSYTIGYAPSNVSVVNCESLRDRCAYRDAGGSYTTLETLSGTYTTGDVIGVAVDMDNDRVYFSKNNGWMDNSDGWTNSTPTNYLDLSLPSINEAVILVGNANASTPSTWVLNFGQDSSFAGNKTAQGNQDGNSIGDFYYTPPSGYKALCTANLPDPAVIPSEHFNTVLYAGNASTEIDVSVGFQPDFIWIKNRSNANSSSLTDSIRGVDKWIISDYYGAERNDSSNNSGIPRINSIGSDGFQVNDNSNSEVNYTGYNYVSWNWKASGSSSSNTNGSITSTVSANQDAGFSIISYTGTGSTATIGHGLSQAPELIFHKKISSDQQWTVYTAAFGATKYLELNEYAPLGTASTPFNNTEPTSSVWTVGSAGGTNTSGSTYIAYAFHSVDGFSKFGSYTGNSSADGTFVYTGFRPAFIMVKGTSNLREWYMFDNARDPDNSTHQYLRANVSNAEGTASNDNFDFVSNGFKIRVNDTYNNSSSESYFYMAFAEHPFKYTNAR